MQEFIALSKQNRLVRDNKTRWNFIARIISRAITSPVYKAIQAYVKRYKTNLVRGDELLEDD